jgi:hypothetical protein
MGSCSKNGLALIRQVRDISELVAVELEHAAQGALLTPLAVEALTKIDHVILEHVNLRLVVEGGT